MTLAKELVVTLGLQIVKLCGHSADKKEKKKTPSTKPRYKLSQRVQITCRTAV